MTTPSNNHRPATLVAIAAAGLLGALVAAAPGSAHTIPARDDPAVTSSVETSSQLNVPCNLDPRYLPRTADAAASWMAGCYEVERLPRTTDVVSGWVG